MKHPYVIKPVTSSEVEGHWHPEGETEGRDVFDSGDWSEDQPTGILTQNGDMIYRCARRIGFQLY